MFDRISTPLKIRERLATGPGWTKCRDSLLSWTIRGKTRFPGEFPQKRQNVSPTSHGDGGMVPD